MAKRLKVFRTSIGFEDAYVAAPSRKAALAAWGTDKDLFARGAAEQILDPELSKAALAKPGEIVRVPRGSLSEYLSAAGEIRKPASAAAAGRAPTRSKAPAKPRKRPPAPSRAELDRARDALARKDRELASAISRVDEQIAELQAHRRDLRTQRDREVEDLQARIKQVEQAYHAALKEWESW